MAKKKSPTLSEQPEPNVNAAFHMTHPVLSHHQPGYEATVGRKNMQQLIQLRWIAVLGQVATIGVAYFVFETPLPLDYLLSLSLVLALFNVISLLRLRIRSEVSNTELLIALLVDVAVLTAQLSLSGGATNPFVFLYLLQVTLAAVLLTPWSTWTVVGVTTLCLVGLALTGQSLALPLDHDRGLSSPYVQGMLICFVLNAGLVVVFMTRISRNLRTRDEHLASLRQRAAEEEHIVRMGLLASGAAHELGTPLATLAVILGDWKHMPSFADDPELLDEINEMQAQVQRCKTIVTSILVSAGKTRGESPTETTVHRFLDTLVEQWRNSRPSTQLVYENSFGQDMRIISDTALKQMICNVLDNALEASPQWLKLSIERRDDQLVLIVADKGRGFSADMLKQLGKPYHSSKDRPGSGLGLFLSVNVARTLGGSITARNLTHGGASVLIRLPLSALTLEDTANDEPGN